MKSLKFKLIFLSLFFLFSCSSLKKYSKINQDNILLLDEIEVSINDFEEEIHIVDVNKNDIKRSIEKTIIPGFKVGGFNLTYDSFIYIESIAKLLNSNNDLQLIVAGHTDNIGNYNYNLLLSKKRAEKIKDELIIRGVDENQIKLEYYGENSPIASNNTETGRFQNRRVELQVFSIK